MMNIEQVMRYLPQRYPFLMVDRVNELTRERIVGIKNVTVNEPFFQGHFPGKPVMPGVMMIEAMAQVAGILGVYRQDKQPEENRYVFAGIENVRFKRMVVPGDRLTLEATFAGGRRGLHKFACRALVDDSLAVSADLLLAEYKL